MSEAILARKTNNKDAHYFNTKKHCSSIIIASSYQGKLFTVEPVARKTTNNQRMSKISYGPKKYAILLVILTFPSKSRNKNSI